MRASRCKFTKRGRAIAASMPRMMITTINSISVKPLASRRRKNFDLFIFAITTHRINTLARYTHTHNRFPRREQALGHISHTVLRALPITVWHPRHAKTPNSHTPARLRHTDLPNQEAAAATHQPARYD